MAITSSLSAGMSNVTSAMSSNAAKNMAASGAAKASTTPFAALMANAPTQGASAASGGAASGGFGGGNSVLPNMLGASATQAAGLMAQQNLTMPQNAGVHAARLNSAQLAGQQLKTLEGLQQGMGKSDSLLDVARNDVGTRNMRKVASTFQSPSGLVPMANSIKAQALAMQHNRGQRHIGMDHSGLGSLSKKFESGSAGMAAIGYDSTGGTSYGSYQIASKVGSMENFLKIAEREAPDIARKLRSAGPANTGSRSGGMPDMWRKLAQEDTSRLQALEKQFIKETHYEPAVNKIAANTDIDTKNMSKAMQEVIFSTAVQHGPTGASRIFTTAAARAGNADDANFEKKLIDQVYSIRSGQFGSSTASVQAAVRNRMHEEKGLALSLLKSGEIA